MAGVRLEADDEFSYHSLRSTIETLERCRKDGWRVVKYNEEPIRVVCVDTRGRYRIVLSETESVEFDSPTFDPTLAAAVLSRERPELVSEFERGSLWVETIEQKHQLSPREFRPRKSVIIAGRLK